MSKKRHPHSHLHTSLVASFAVAGLLLLAVVYGVGARGNNENGGYDQYGYNPTARMFNGKADGVDKQNDGTFWGDPTYANDKLVMKWSQAWDDARYKNAEWTCDAWVDNEWNGKVQGGSGEVWHYKIVWVGSELQKSKCWKPGGYPIWGQFEVIMSQGTVDNKHIWDALATPNGLGGF